MKSTTTAYVLWFFLGLWGAHKFYLGKTGIGIVYFFTFGILGIGWFIDVFTLKDQVEAYNALLRRQSENNNTNTNTNNIVVNVPGYNTEKPSNISEQLQGIYDLKEKGILSEEEYSLQKSKILN